MIKKVLTVLLIAFSSVCAAQTVENRIAEIRKEFAAINNQKNFRIDTATVAISEGGSILKYYDSSKQLRKISATYYGEMGKGTEEYYLKDDKLMFVYYKYYSYDKPFGKVIKTEENRYYFDKNERLIQWIEGKNIKKKDKEFEKEDSKVVSEYALLRGEA